MKAQRGEAMAQTSLFDGEDDGMRARLEEAGWVPAGTLLFGKPCWRSPDGLYCLEEEEAFRRLRSGAIGEVGDGGSQEG